jgi:hypothetical protein
MENKYWMILVNCGTKEGSLNIILLQTGKGGKVT